MKIDLIDAELVYLAAPYSGTKEEIEARMKVFSIVDAELLSRGYFTISPLSKHFILHHSSLPGTWDFWEHYSKKLIAQCNKIIVIKIDGWDTSVGVQAEIAFAEKVGISVMFYNPSTSQFE